MEIVPMTEAAPSIDGRYTVFVTDPLQRRWATPVTASWFGGRFDCAKLVYAWIGPWPTGLVNDLWPQATTDVYAEVAKQILNIEPGEGDRRIGKSAMLAVGYGQEYDL